MTFVALWSSVILIAAAVVLSLMMWRRQRDIRALLLTALLTAIAARFGLYAAMILWGLEAANVGVWVQLATAFLGVAAVVGFNRVLADERRRRLAISQIQRALDEVIFGLGKRTELDFCRLAVERLNSILGTDYAFVGELLSCRTRVRIVAIAGSGSSDEPVVYDLEGTPCQGVIGREPCYHPHSVQQQFPQDRMLVDMGVDSYLGIPLKGQAEEPIGLLAVLSSEPLEDSGVMLPALKIVASRVEAELQRSRQSQELQASEQRFRELFEESQDALFITTPEGQMIDANPEAVRIFGYVSRDQLLREFRAVDHYADPTDRDVVLAHIERDDRVRDLIVDLKQRTGRIVTVQFNSVAKRNAVGELVSMRGSLRDITEQRELQKRSLRSQRMEAVGRMAGGVAHDFNNMLTVIRGQSDLLRESITPGSQEALAVSEINDAVDRAAAFNRRLLLLSRSKVLAPQIIDLNAVIGDLSMILETAVGDDVDLRLDLGRNIDTVVADATEMEQVMLNLVINARDAMPDGGRLVVTTRNLVLNDSELEPGEGDRWIELAVEDDGAGIESEHVDYIFEPFYTTKDVGSGTGLGLSTVFGIVQELKGKLSVDSTPGEGSRFSIRLPSATARDLDEPAVILEPAGEPGQERLLVVDDEPGVRLMLQRFLEKQGYAVEIASNGREALERIREANGFDLMISDVMMPGMTGPRLAEQARLRHQDLRVLLITGFAGVGDAEHQYPLLRKPFTTSELGERIREVLATPG